MTAYTADELAAIVTEAARRQHDHDETFTEDDVIAIASEFGIDADHVAAAMAKRTSLVEAETRRLREMRSFRAHATAYALVIGSMWIAAVVGGAVAIATGVWGAIPFWVVFPTFGWGIGLWSHWNKVQRIGTDSEWERRSRHRRPENAAPRHAPQR